MPHDMAPRQPASPRMPTRLELPEEIQAAIQARQAELFANAPTTAAGPPPLPQNPSAQAAKAPTIARVYKPMSRPPMAILTAFDDGSDDGETVRIRAERFVIGRTEGDLKIPHDSRISARHAELVRQLQDDGRWMWTLRDLDSTNGTFARVATAILKDGQEFLVGRTRYQFTAGIDPSAAAANSELAGGATPNPSRDEATAPSKSARTTMPLSSDAGKMLLPSLAEFMPAGLGARVPLFRDEHWLGADRTYCEIVPTDDDFVSPRHARLSRDSKGRWHIANNKSINGVWLRIDEIELQNSCYFQIGEQRFSFKVH